MLHRTLTFSLIALLVSLLTACGAQMVQPWQKQDIARPEMQLNSTPTHNAFDRHFYFSKEGSSGGAGFAGSGCGCN